MAITQKAMLWKVLINLLANLDFFVADPIFFLNYLTFLQTSCWPDKITDNSTQS